MTSVLYFIKRHIISIFLLAIILYFPIYFFLVPTDYHSLFKQIFTAVPYALISLLQKWGLTEDQLVLPFHFITLTTTLFISAIVVFLWKKFLVGKPRLRGNILAVIGLYILYKIANQLLGFGISFPPNKCDLLLGYETTGDLLIGKRDSCLYNLALEEESSLVCKNLGVYFEDKCLEDIALKKGDTSICKKIKLEPYKSNCLRQFGTEEVKKDMGKPTETSVAGCYDRNLDAVIQNFSQSEDSLVNEIISICNDAKDCTETAQCFYGFSLKLIDEHPEQVLKFCNAATSERDRCYELLSLAFRTRGKIEKAYFLCDQIKPIQSVNKCYQDLFDVGMDKIELDRALEVCRSTKDSFQKGVCFQQVAVGMAKINLDESVKIIISIDDNERREYIYEAVALELVKNAGGVIDISDKEAQKEEIIKKVCLSVKMKSSYPECLAN